MNINLVFPLFPVLIALCCLKPNCISALKCYQQSGYTDLVDKKAVTKADLRKATEWREQTCQSKGGGGGGIEGREEGEHGAYCLVATNCTPSIWVRTRFGIQKEDWRFCVEPTGRGWRMPKMDQICQKLAKHRRAGCSQCRVCNHRDLCNGDFDDQPAGEEEGNKEGKKPDNVIENGLNKENSSKVDGASSKNEPTGIKNKVSLAALTSPISTMTLFAFAFVANMLPLLLHI